MFALEKPTTIKLKKFDTLSSKDRDTSENVGLQVIFGGATLSADLLALLDGSLRSWLFEKKTAAVASSSGKKGEQKSLDGVETETLTVCGKKLGTLPWNEELTGYTVEIDPGLGGRSAIVLSDCKVYGIKFKLKDGGAWDVTRIIVDSPNVAAAVIGKVGTWKSQEVKIRLQPPAVHDDLVDQAGKGGGAEKPAVRTPEQALAEAAGATVQ
jgi:hypothetical protein